MGRPPQPGDLFRQRQRDPEPVVQRIPTTDKPWKGLLGREGHPGRERTQSRTRLTPFLVLRLTPDDSGARPVMQAIVPEMHTLRVATAGEPNVAFDLHSGTAHEFTGAVTNRGMSPVLMGLASLYIVPGKVLMDNWERSITPFDIVDFQAWPNREARFRFKRTWTPVLDDIPINRRISIFIHVQDLAGDRSDFFLTNTGVDRHIARRDFRLS